MDIFIGTLCIVHYYQLGYVNMDCVYRYSLFVFCNVFFKCIFVISGYNLICHQHYVCIGLTTAQCSW